MDCHFKVMDYFMIHAKTLGTPGAEPMQSNCRIQRPDITKTGRGEGSGPRKLERSDRGMDVEVSGYGSDPDDPMINIGFS